MLISCEIGEEDCLFPIPKNTRSKKLPCHIWQLWHCSWARGPQRPGLSHCLQNSKIGKNPQHH